MKLNRHSKKLRLTLFLQGLLLSWTVQASLPESAAWRFAVSIDDRPVGFHEFKVESNAAMQSISSQAEFNVKVLFVNVFRYVHENTEQWESDCLRKIDSATRMNRKSFAVTGYVKEGGLVVSTTDATQSLPGCVQTFAYWNPEFLSATQLLNSQTGKLESVTVYDKGVEELTVVDQLVQANRYRIELDKGHVDVWYDAMTQLWLGLESVTPNGERIRYEAVVLPKL